MRQVQVFDGDGIEPSKVYRPTYVDVVVVTGNARYQGEIEIATYHEMNKLKTVRQLTLWDNNVPMMECGNVSIKKHGVVVELYAEKVSWVAGRTNE